MSKNSKESLLSKDARTVLFHLNELGFRNITAEHLKEFMKDLRKLIKYENNLGSDNSSKIIGQISEKNTTSKPASSVNFITSSDPKLISSGFITSSSTHNLRSNQSSNMQMVNSSNSSLSSSSWSDRINDIYSKHRLNLNNEFRNRTSISSSSTSTSYLSEQMDLMYGKGQKNFNKIEYTTSDVSQRIRSSADFDSSAYKTTSKTSSNLTNTNRRIVITESENNSTSKSSVTGKNFKTQSSSSDVQTPSSSSNGKSSISGAFTSSPSRSSNKLVVSRKHTKSLKANVNTDPVLLYHYYQNEWKRFKNYLPGENNHSDVRQQVRNKLLGKKTL